LAWAVVTATLGLARAEPPPELQPVEGRVIWVDFWASWCVPCRRSFPWLNSMQRKYGPQGLQIIAVNLDKERKLADAFLAEVPAEFALRFDAGADLAKQFAVQTMPSSFLLDADGNVLEKHLALRLQNGRYGRIRERDSRGARRCRGPLSIITRRTK
jgi:thiol-disulfide isomerase/thioredoxin